MIGKITAILLLPASALLAQSGAIAGTVIDGHDLPVGKAAIQVRNESTGASFSAESGANGTYTLPSVTPGRYTLSAFVPGMMPYQRPNVTVTAAQTLRLDFRMDDFNGNVAGEDREFYARLWYPPEQKGKTRRASDGKPDLSGVWRPALPVDWGTPDPLPWAAAKAKEWMDRSFADIPQSRCLPGGMDLTTLVTPFKFVQTPKLVLILFDDGDLPRQIFTDGRGHPKEYGLLTWAGHSIGRWERDTLIVDTQGFNDLSWVGFPFHPHTEMLHMIERIRRPDLGHLEIETTLEDPGAFNKPWTYRKIYRLAPAGEDVEEYICNENNRDLSHYVNGQQ